MPTPLHAEETLPALQRARLAALRELQQARGLDAFIVFAQGGVLGAAARSPAYLRLFVDWDGHDQSSLLVVAGGRCTLLVSSPFQIAAAAQVTGVDAVVCAPPAEVGSRLAAVLASLGLPSAPALGLAGHVEMPVQSWNSLTAALPQATHVDCSAELDAWRVHKRRAEIDGLARAGALCDVLFSALGGFLRADREAWKVQRDIEHLALIEGAEYCKTWLTISPTADAPRYLKRECGRIPQAGDQVLLGLMLKRDGYWGHAIRMGSYRHAQSAHLRLHATVRRMFDAALPYCRIGCDLRDAESEINAILKADLSDVPAADLSRFRNGHGLGLAYEEPLSVAAFPQHADPGPAPAPKTLKVEFEGVFELHPNIFVRGLGGAALGDMVHASSGPARCMLCTSLDYSVWS